MCILILQTPSFSQKADWVKQWGNKNWDEAVSIATDAAGNVYTLGNFYDTLDLDPSAQVLEFVAKGSKDIYISKINPSGQLIWASQIGGTAWSESNAIAIDPVGNILICGSFLGTTDFDPGAGSFNLTTGQDIHGFICKLSAAGDFIWAKQFGGTAAVNAYAIKSDLNANVYTTGYFDGRTDFDPGPGSFPMTARAYSDIFVSKLDASGNFVWAKQFGGAQSGEVGYAIALDGNGNVYTTGTFTASVDFDPGPGNFVLNTSLFGEIFICKLDSTGSFVWAKQLGGIESRTLAIDNGGKVVLVGMGYDNWKTCTVIKLETDGAINWMRQLPVNSCTGIALDSDNNIYSTGAFFGTRDFDPGPGTFMITGGNSDSYISELDASGQFVRAKGLSATEQIWSTSVSIDKANNLYGTGYFSGTVSFDSTFQQTALGSYDVFLLKLRLSEDPGRTGGNSQILVYPNPTPGRLRIVFRNGYNCSFLQVVNALGQLLYRTTVNGASSVELGLPWAKGIYFLEAFDQGGQKSVLKLLKY